MREILTVQIGGFANFVGSHFWNFQDELLGLAEDPYADPVFKNDEYMDMDVLYRSGQTQRGILTWTPRLVSVDFKGSLGCMSYHGTLYNEELPAASVVDTWSGNVSTHTFERREKNLFLQSLDEEQKTPVEGKNGSQRKYDDKDIVECLENGVKFWTDFSKVHYHPQSLYGITGSGTNEDFNNYGTGKDTLSVDLQGEEISERLRFFVEECDHIQGFQFVVDDSGGFSAVAADILENIADEYGNTPVFLYTVRGPDSYVKAGNQKQKMLQGLHDAISFSRLSSYCKLVVPVGLPSLSTSKASKFLGIKDEKRYHSSAVYAAAIHSMSLPYRMKRCSGTRDVSSGAAGINEIIQMLSGQARKNMVAILDVAMPAPSLVNGKGVEQCLVSHLQTVTSETGEDTEDVHAVETIATHGVFGPDGGCATASEVEDSIDAAYYELRQSRPKFCHVSVGRAPVPIPLPFPSIFKNQVGSRGELLLDTSSSSSSSSSLRGSLDVHSVPMAARLRSSTAILPYLESRLGNLRNFGMKRGALGAELLRRSWGFGSDDLEDLGESLSRMIMELKPPHTHNDSDDDSD